MPEYESDDYDELEHEEHQQGPTVSASVEITGLSLYTHHGVTEAEREIGQRVSVDIEFNIGEPDALVTDRIEDTIDYSLVCQEVALVAQQRSYKTLERLCAVIAERLADKYGVNDISVRVAKPEPPLPLPVSEIAVQLWREDH